METDVPDRLRKTSYIRLCCTVLPRGSYSHLLRGLFLCNKEWWKECDVSPEGLLLSVNPCVSTLLRPISRLQAQVSGLPVPSLPPMAPAAKNLVCRTAG